MYIELHSCSAFSFLRGGSFPEQLAEVAAELGMPAIALCDPTVLTCAANDFGFESIFSRQIEALGNPQDVFIALTTSGNSANLVRAVEAAQARRLLTVAFLGKDGGQLRGKCDIELLIPSPTTARIQECQKLLYHCLCEWIESKIE